MNLSHPSDSVFPHWREGGSMTDQLRHQPVKIEAPVEPEAGGAGVLPRVLAELQRLVGALNHGFEPAQHRVYPLELWQVTRLSATRDDVGVSAARVDDPSKAAQAIAAHIATRREVLARPVGDRLRREARDRNELDAQRVAGIGGGDRCDERNLVRGSTATGAPTLTTEVRIVDLNHAIERRLAVTLGHGPHDLLVHQPRGAIGRAVALQRQRGQTSLGLTDQEHRQEPCAQRKLRAVHRRARRQRDLMPAFSAWVQLARPMAHDQMSRTRTSRAAKTVRPTLRSQRRSALRFAAEALRELGHGHTRSELNLIHRLRGLPSNDGGQLRRQLAHGKILSELCDESG